MGKYNCSTRTICAFGIATGIVAATSGCTTLLSASKVTSFDATSVGQIYYLPRSEYQIVLSRELKSCSVEYNNDASAALAWLEIQLRSIKAADRPEDAVDLLEKTLNDPILARADIEPVIESVLSKNWRSKAEYAPPARSGGEEGNENTRPTKRTVNDTELTNFTEAIGKLSLKPELRMNVDLAAHVAANFVPDTSHTYTLNYNLMGDGLKATEYAVETYTNGTLKSVNVTIDDQTGPAVLSVIGGAGKLAAAASGFPLPQAHSAKSKAFQSFKDWQDELSERPFPPACRPDVQWKIHQRKGLEAQASSIAESALAQKRLADKLDHAHVQAIVVQEKAKTILNEINESDPKRPEAEARLKKAEGDVKLAATKALDAKAQLSSTMQVAEQVEKRLTSIRSSLTVIQSTTFRPTASTSALDLPGAAESLRAWLHPNYLDPCDGNPGCRPPDNSALERSLGANAAIYVPSLSSNPVKTAEVTGVFYRQPLRATLLVCRSEPCITDGSITVTPEALLISTLVDIPQLGALAVLPLKNGPFQNNTISASFAESGALTKVTYRSNAAASKAAEAFESTADIIMKFREAKRNQETSKLEASASELEAQKKLVDAQLALEKAQAELENFREKEAASPLE